MAVQIVTPTYTYPVVENATPIGSLVVHLACTSATGGAISYALPSAIMEMIAPVAPESTSARRSKMYLYLVVTDPGSTAPTDNWDLTITDAGAGDIDLLAGAGANRHTTTTQYNVPASTVPMAVCGALTVAVANAGDEKTLTLHLYFSAYR